MKDTKLTYSVYLIKLGEDVMYVGETSDFERRKYDHLHRIGETKQRSAIPEGTNLSEITIIKAKDFNDREEALKYEDELILQYNTIDNGWNNRRSGRIYAEDRKAYDKKWNEEHKAERKAYKKKWREEHKDYNKNWREAHKEELKAANNKWREENRERRNAYERERRRKIKLSKLNKEEQI